MESPYSCKLCYFSLINWQYRAKNGADNLLKELTKKRRGLRRNFFFSFYYFNSNQSSYKQQQVLQLSNEVDHKKINKYPNNWQ